MPSLYRIKNFTNNFTLKKKRLFLQALTQGSSVDKACDKANISRRTAYNHRNKDNEFKQNWEYAIEFGTDKLEDTALNRALDHSDTLLMFLLKGRRPVKFVDRRLTSGMDRNGNAIEYSNTECAVRLGNIFANVFKNKSDEQGLIETIKSLGIDKAVQQK